jgi:hypothetical protein
MKIRNKEEKKLAIRNINVMFMPFNKETKCIMVSKGKK